jgi:hypothetical protein
MRKLPLLCKEDSGLCLLWFTLPGWGGGFLLAQFTHRKRRVKGDVIQPEWKKVHTLMVFYTSKKCVPFSNHFGSSFYIDT